MRRSAYTHTHTLCMYACIRKRTFLSRSLSLFLSLGACSRRLRTRTLTRDSDTILHSNAGQEAPASLVHRPRISTGSRSASSLTLTLSLSLCLRLAPCPCALSFAPKGLKRDAARNKNNKKCFLPFCLYISHLASFNLVADIFEQFLSLFFSVPVYLFVKLKSDVARFFDERDLKLKFNRRVYR